jgi:putative tricarboxylic transport membrane protein
VTPHCSKSLYKKRGIKMKKRLLVLTLALVVAAFAFAGCSSSSSGSKGAKSDFPKKPIQIIVGWGAGGGTDVFARAIAQPASEIAKQPINVVNMAGASGSVAGDYVTKQPADGYTIWAEGSNYPVNVAMGTTPHELKDYIPIARIQQDTGSIQVAKDSKFKTIEDFIAFAKANPGQLTIGGTGAGGFDTVVVAKFQEAAGIQLKYVPFESAGEMHSALLGGHIDSEIEEFGPVVKLLQDGSIKALVALTDAKIAQYPDVPTSVEKGINVTDGMWRGLFVKAGTPQEVVDYLRNLFAKAKDADSYKAVEKSNLLDLRKGYMDGPDFAKQVQSDIDTYKEYLKKLGYIK